MFACEKVLNFLPVAVVLAETDGPDETIYGAGDLPCPARPLLDLGIALKKGRQPFDTGGLQPQPDRFPISIQLSCDGENRKPP